MNRADWTPGDENVARLLGQAYDPPPVPAAFAERVQARLLEVATEAARRRTPSPRPSRVRRRLAALAGVAALLGIVALGLRFLPGPPTPSASPPAAVLVQRIVAAPARSPARSPMLSPGQVLATRAGERRRVALPDDSVLSLNQNTTLHYDALRHLTLKAGEIFVEIAPHRAEKASSLFTVATPHRDIRAIGTKFLVRADTEGTGVAVTQGQVHVSDGDGLLCAGQQLAPKVSVATPAPRTSFLLAWMRDLVVSAAPPLVPPSAYAGGALVAVDPQGRAAPLSLRKYHLDVHIEDGFARTTIDQTYFNHTAGRLEGKFYFPLPADASLSRLAMYVDGRLMEGGMVERDYGRVVFEQIVTKMKDPALLEWVDGHTFSMRVFPLEARQEKRILLSYTQRLPNLYGRLSYRFPAGHSLGTVREWSFHARVKGGAKLDWRCDTHNLTPRVEKDDLLLDACIPQVAMERDFALDLCDSAGADAARFATAEQDGFRYLMLRYRPELPGTTQPPRRDWVFLFESSADRDPLLARTQVEVIRTLLTNAEHGDTFTVLTAGTQVRQWAAPQAVTPENIASSVAFLEGTHLLGALDLDAGLTAAAELLRNSEHPILVHCGSGQAVLGERRPEVLASRIPPSACYVGVAVGKHWAQDFMRRAAERCQGHVTPINPDESVAWRAFDLLATLNTPRLLDVRVTDPTGKAQFLCPSTLWAQGEELCAIARLPAGAPLPASVHIHGVLDGQPFERELAVASPRSGAAYLPRTWARLEIDRLLAENAEKNKNTIIALSKAMYVMTPFTSLLVLENEAMYAQYKVDRGRKDHWAMYPCPPTIPVVYEPLSPSEKRVFAPSIDWAIQFDPITGQPLNPLGDQEWEWLNQENNQLGFYPPALALAVKASSTIHNRAGSLAVSLGISNGVANFYGTQWRYVSYLSETGSRININSTAQYGLTIQQAKIVRQQALQESYRTRRAMMEQAEYERAHRPDPEKIRQAALQRELDRARTSPPLTEIYSGRSLNALLRHLIAQQGQGVRGPNVPLSEDTLKSINLTADDTRGNVGLLKDKGNLQWPQSLQGKLYKDVREDLSRRMKEAFRSVQLNRNPDEDTLNDLQADLKKLQEMLDANASAMSPDQYVEARRYLRLVGNTITTLRDPNVSNYINGVWTPRGKNVAELVQFLRDKNLWFAPATPSEGSAYVALYHALAAFDAGMPRRPAPTIGRTIDDGDRVETVRPPMFKLDEDASPAADHADPEGAERLLAALLVDPVQAKRPSLWRQAADVAEQCRQYDLARQRLEHALQLEAKAPRDLAALRRDYAWLLRVAHKRVKEQTSQHRATPSDLLDRVMAVADHWRTVDPVDWVPCHLAARILGLAGERELAWSYLTTPAALHGATVATWLEVARQQHGQGDYDLAERAFAAASSLNPDDPSIVRERAGNLRAAGRNKAARELLKRMERPDW